MPHKYLNAAITLYRELGWPDAAIEQIPTLPLGDAKQQEIARQGLSSGKWDRIERRPIYRHVDYLSGESPYKLTLFALRLGVSPKRIIELRIEHGHRTDFRLFAQLAAARGRDYALEFIAAACTSGGNPDVLDSDTDFNLMSIFLVTSHLHEYDIPTNTHYLMAWLHAAALALNCPDAINIGHNQNLPSWTELEPTFTRHLRACFAANIPLWTVAGSVSIAGLELGLIPREEVVSAAVSSLATAVERSQQRHMMNFLFQELAPIDADIVNHWDGFVEFLNVAAPHHVVALGERMITSATPECVADVAIPALYVPTLTGQRRILKALALRADLDDTAIKPLLDRVLELGDSADTEVSRRALALVKQWGRVPETSTSKALYRWQNPPSLWQLPRFERMPASVTAIVEVLATGLFDAGVTTVETEQCMVAFLELCRLDPDAAARIGAGKTVDDAWWWPFFAPAIQSTPASMSEHGSAIAERNYQLVRSSVPCMLSEPSFVDLSISFDDLLARLDIYSAHNVSILEPDLVVALCRLSTANIDISSAQHKLRSYTIKIVRNLTYELPHTVGEVIADFLTTPLGLPSLERGVSHGNAYHTLVTHAEKAATTSRFIDVGGYLFNYSNHDHLDPGIVPRWGDVAWTRLRFRRNAANIAANQLAQQAARSATPLMPGTAMNLIAATVGGNGAGQQAIVDAWSRGLLLPGMPDPAFLDWNPQGNSHAKLTRIAQELADMGMVAIAWHLLDTALAQCITPTIGTAQVARTLLEFAPSVANAIENGDASRDVAQLPGVRRFADLDDRNSTSNYAQQIIEKLPSPVNIAAISQPTLAGWDDPEPPVIIDNAPVNCRTSPIDPKRRVVEIDHTRLNHRCWELSGAQLYVSPFCFDMVLDSHEIILDKCQDGRMTSDYAMQWNGSQWILKPKTPLDCSYPPIPMPQTVVFILLATMGPGKTGNAAQRLFLSFLIEKKISSQLIALTTRELVGTPEWSPLPVLKLLRTTDYLPTLWPLLSECVSGAVAAISAGEAPPAWLGKILNTCIAHGETLRAATATGYIPIDTWIPLHRMTEIATGSIKTKALAAYAAIIQQ
ncbi:MAG: hypothetical protein Q4D85_07370 [Corynebacterium sp.]|uniref:hypothetical protein n=1 Tax=Corynebacterium sp. TaxID=1720 RepID=UPI0026DBFE95|nr:hypothetical protein [Corynebacterium sp.]MDO5098567.1 hypothetical protein [Corynebacterium sp.]